jgi:hypothetical protein
MMFIAPRAPTLAADHDTEPRNQREAQLIASQRRQYCTSTQQEQSLRTKGAIKLKPRKWEPTNEAPVRHLLACSLWRGLHQTEQDLSSPAPSMHWRSKQRHPQRRQQIKPLNTTKFTCFEATSTCAALIVQLSEQVQWTNNRPNANWARRPLREALLNLQNR